MKNLKNIHRFINEWLDSPGSIDVPGQNSEIRVNSRNYKTQNQQLPEVFDAMFEAAYFHDFLDEEGKSEKFNKFLPSQDRFSSLKMLLYYPCISGTFDLVIPTPSPFGPTFDYC
jgi:hypothetical protein